jgi:uncharacterized protein
MDISTHGENSMNRRDFLKSALTVAALAPVTRLTAKEGADGDKLSDVSQGAQVTRRHYKDTAQTLPLLGFGCMRLPRLSPEDTKIDYVTAKKMIAQAMAAGCNYFDTAYMYHDGESERCLGTLLQDYPRDSYYLTDKMPVWFAKTEKDVERIFNEQLERWEQTQKLHALDFLKKMKAEGKIRRLGFSFHDTPEMLQKIVDAYDGWDVAQIQLNYLDWELYRSREQYEILTKAGIPVLIMEPLRGGALATLTPDAVKILKQSAPQDSTASWALRYVASLPNVLCVLSGMSLPEQMEDNIKTFTPLKPLTDNERKVLAEALVAYRKCLAVPCTGCRYCMPCPVGVEIPRIFGIYNQYKASGNQWLFNNNYMAIPEESRASACVNCRRCMQHCPQKIVIPEQLKKIAKEAEG